MESIHVCFVHCLDLCILYFKCSTRLSMGSFFSMEAICGIARPPSLLRTTTRLSILCFVFYTLHFVICISNAPLPLLTPYNRKTASNSKVNTRTKNSIKTSWPLMIIHKLQEKNILRKKLYCFTIFRTFRQGSVSQGRVPVDVEGVSSNK